MTVVKNLPTNAEDTGDASSIPGLVSSPGKGNGNPLQHSCLKNPRKACMFTLPSRIWWGSGIYQADDLTVLTRWFLIDWFNLPFLGETKTVTESLNLEKEMAIHSSTIAWKIPWTEEPGKLQSMGSQRVRHNWATFLSFPFLSFPLMTWDWA